MLKPISLFTLFIFSVFSSFSQTKLPLIFSDNMVLQQQQQVSIWGMDNAKAKITVTGSWGNNATVVADENGKWKLKLQTPVAGGSYSLTIKGSKEITFNNVLIGEVWFCSGQSNMQMTVNGNYNQPIIGSNEAILNSTNDNIRMFTHQKSTSITPLYDMQGDWKSASPATTGNFSAVAYFFAKKLQGILGVPIGLIHASWGASSVESWMDKETLAEFKNIVIPDTVPKPTPQQSPTIMYNSLLHPYIGYTMKGVLWYQGESNVIDSTNYQAKFSAMIASWRKQWGQGDFPFYFVQIASHGYTKANAAYLREAQTKTMQTVKNTGMAVTMDIGEEKVIHPSQKEPVGVRLAYWALAKDYNVKGVTFSGPVYKAMRKTNNDRIVLSFDFAGMGLTSFGKPLTDFEIAGEDKVFYPANAIINNPENNGGIVVWSDSVKNPVSVRYGFKSWVQGCLYNVQGLPASSFRTDNW